MWTERIVVASHIGDLDRALEADNRSLDLFREVGDTCGVVSILTILAEQRRQRGEYRAAPLTILQLRAAAVMGARDERHTS